MHAHTQLPSPLHPVNPGPFILPSNPQPLYTPISPPSHLPQILNLSTSSSFKNPNTYPQPFPLSIAISLLFFNRLLSCIFPSSAPSSVSISSVLLYFVSTPLGSFILSPPPLSLRPTSKSPQFKKERKKSLMRREEEESNFVKKSNNI